MKTFLNANCSQQAERERQLDRIELADVLPPLELKRATSYYPNYERPDLERRQAVISKRLARASGQSISALGPLPSVPPALCQFAATEVRLAIGRGSVDMVHHFNKGYPALFVTVADRDWLRDAGKLDASVFNEVREWCARRCRRLAKHFEFRAIGVVDVAWCDRGRINKVSNWSVHAHILVVPFTKDGAHGYQLTNAAFEPSHRRCNGGAALRVDTLKRGQDLIWTREYVSWKLLAEALQHRISYFDLDGIRQTRDRALNAPQALELYEALKSLPPRKRVILSRYRWRQNGGFTPMTDHQVRASQRPAGRQCSLGISHSVG